MKKKLTQRQAILSLFKQGKTLNILTCFKLTGSMKLSTRVSEFRQEGFRFEQKPIKFKTRFGTTGKYFNYKLLKK